MGRRWFAAEPEANQKAGVARNQVITTDADLEIGATIAAHSDGETLGSQGRTRRPENRDSHITSKPSHKRLISPPGKI
jgi:hypothetical protein